MDRGSKDSVLRPLPRWDALVVMRWEGSVPRGSVGRLREVRFGSGGGGVSVRGGRLLLL